MYYTCHDGVLEKFPTLGKHKEDTVTIGYLTLDQFAECYQDLGFSEESYEACRFAHHRSHSTLEVYDCFSFVILHLLNIEQVQEPRKKLAIFFRKNFMLLVGLEEPGREWEDMLSTVAEHAASQFTIERILCGILIRLLGRSNDILEEYEQRILEMEKKILDSEFDREINRTIFGMRNDLTIRKNYFQDLLSFSEALQEDENDLFSDDTFRYLHIFDGRVDRLIGNTQILCESLIHVRETYQAALDYNLNNTMKIFTVVTTVFLPLSLIVGWYGMNFTNMPELTWKYGYLAVILLSVAVVIFCFWFFKKKKLL